ncbi:GNAT family N-acetyltransferase [Streptomyces sp. NPDC051211]|uniref:GNAT family N-acetyltransferase n=1 Tax=Streptomyces sp. NPDC051211 TaxID=3154643 RepID=UPI00344F9296
MAVEWVRLALDLEAFDESPFLPRLRSCREAGVELTTMAAVGDTPEHRRALYELNKACSADIPGRGAFHTFDEYLAQRIETPVYDPRGVVLARDGDAWIGMAATTIRPEGFAFSEMTGVRAGYRGRGISLAMKLLAIGFARSGGVPVLRAFHHPGNTVAIAMNRRLGFVPEPAQG